MKKALSLLGCIIGGILIPQASEFSYLIRYLLMFILFMPFLECKISFSTFHKKEVYFVLFVNILIGITGYFLLKNYNSDLALIALIVGMTPTATASPAVIRFLGGKVDFAVAAVLITNIVISIILPFIFKAISDIDISVYTLLFQILKVVLIPLLLGQFIHYLFPKLTTKLLKFRNFGFYAWVIVCFIAVAKSSAFIRSSDVEPLLIITIAAISGVFALINFNLGRLLGGKNLALETSQTLGQKNTILSLWIALTYFSPLIALGPIFYLIWHNLYNAYQLSKTKH